MKKFINWFIEGTVLEDKNTTTKEKLIALGVCFLMIILISIIFIGFIYLAYVNR